MKLEGYTPKKALMKPDKASKQLELDDLCRIVPALHGWVSYFNGKEFVVRMPVDMWHKPFALAWEDNVLWQLVPVFINSAESHSYHIWAAVDRETERAFLPNRMEFGGFDLLVCKDWKKVKSDWIKHNLISDIENSKWDYNNLPGKK